MGAIAEGVAGAISGIFDAGKTIYDIWSNERDFDYQKSLQNQIFAREDNAVQRRMEDLKKAGLNPNLAAGSAAGAGAVVGRSNTPSLSGNPIGTALDAASAVQQLRSQRKQNELLDNQLLVSNWNLETSKMQNVLDQAQLLWQLGIKDNLELGVNKDGQWDIRASTGHNKKGVYNISADAPIFKQLQWQYDNNKNAADLLQKDVDFYTADKIADYFGIGASIFSGIGAGYKNFNFMKQYRR